MRTVDEIKADIAKVKERLPEGVTNTDVCELAAELILATIADMPLDRLTEMCTAEREGRLVVLPVKVGCEIFTISDCSDEVNAETIWSIEIHDDDRVAFNSGPHDGHICYTDELGRIDGDPFWGGYFLSYDEAADALAQKRAAEAALNGREL